MKNLILLIYTLLAGLTVSAQHDLSLRIGDPAPAIRYSKWVKGAALNAFNENEVYVLEFWATWCGPCRAAMPHLTSLQKQYGDKIRIIGVDIWEDKKMGKPHAAYVPMVEQFVRENDANMGYDVMVDSDVQFMGEHWMKAAGQEGIPSTFIVKHQKVVWIGGPTALDSILPKILDGTYELNTSRANQEKQAEATKKQLEAWMRISTPIRDALNNKDFDKATELMSKALAVNPDYKTAFYYWKFDVLSRHAPKKAIAFGEQWLKEDDAAAVLIMGSLSKEDGLDKSVYAWSASEYIARKEDPGVFDLHSLAAVYGRAGDFRNAVMHEENAVKLAEKVLKDGEMVGLVTVGILEQFKAALKAYRNGKLPEPSQK